MNVFSLLNFLFLLTGSLATWEEKDRADWLRAEIARHDELYYTEGRPEISDEEYDLLQEELRSIEGKNKPGERFPIRSLRKGNSDEELRQFIEDVFEARGEDSAVLVVEPKVDGVAVLLTYRDGQLCAARTRGQGSTGQEILDRVRLISDIPVEIPAPLGSLLEVRGEIFLSKAGFKRLNDIRLAHNLEPYAIPRSAAAGLISKEEVSTEELGCLRAVVFGNGYWAGYTEPASYLEWIRLIKKWGFPVLQDVETADSWISLLVASEALRKRLPDLSYPTDGLVIKVDSMTLKKELGESNGIPNWAIARKYPTGQALTIVRKIVSEVGKTGRITPVADLIPVELKGRTIRRATLHNFAYLREMDLREGDWVEVELAGDVIPSIKSVLRDHRTNESIPLSQPGHCPICRTSVVASQSGRLLYCPNLSCRAAGKSGLQPNGGAPAAGRPDSSR